MQNWPIILDHIYEILAQHEYRHGTHYKGERCFLTAYQIAVLVDQRDSTLKGYLPIGGYQTGTHISFAQQIAQALSVEIHKNQNRRLEIHFLSTAGLECFLFDNKHKPSLNEFSMFRLVDNIELNE